MKKKYKKKNVLVPVLVLTILGITLGYAYLNTDLNINGTTNVSSASWNIYWDNIVLGPNNVTDVTTPATIQSGDTEVVFNVNFSQPGDTYEFTVDAVNDGTIDAMIGSLSAGVYAINGTTPKALPYYLEYNVTYSDGQPVNVNDLLAAGSRETYKVRVHYIEDIYATDLPDTADNYLFKMGGTYVQSGSSASVVSHTLYGVYGEQNKLTLNQAVPSTTTLRFSASEAMNDWESLSGIDGFVIPSYLKQIIEKGVVKESYVETIITPETIPGDGVQPGIYAIRGGINEENLTDKPIYEANIEVLKQLYGYSSHTNRCYDDDNRFVCSAFDTYSVVRMDGLVYFSLTDGTGCVVLSNGESLCSYES